MSAHMPERLHDAAWPAWTPRELTVPETGLADNLVISARRYPQRTAVRFYGQDITYASLAERVSRLAGHLRAQGVQPGDRVMLDMQNSATFIVACYAILHAGAVVVPVNPMNMGDELRWMLQDSGAQVALVAQELWPRVQPLLAEGLLRHVVVAAYACDLPPSPQGPVPAEIATPLEALNAPGLCLWADALRAQALPCSNRGGDDLAVLAYTSGTTGHPKGCMLSHRALQAAVWTLVVWNRWSTDAVALATAPYFHITGMVGSMHVPLAMGASIVLLPRWDREAAAALIAEQQVTHWTNIPTMVADLLALPEVEQRDFSSMVYIGGGGTAMPAAVAQRLHALTGLTYQEGWGLTEVCGAIHLNPPGGERRQCLGIPTFGVDTRVVAVDEHTRELPVGEHGELVVRCPSLFSGYWQLPEATQAASVDLGDERYFRTGDIGYVDGDGYFYMADRLKRMINASGYKVWPAEVEAMLYHHEAIQEACVIGTRDAKRGETVKAVVVLKAGAHLSEADLIAWAREHMAAYKIPRVVAFVDALPKSGSGKIMWRQLQEAENA